ncbi:DnaJ-domain-containing protein [Meredithblackwellia eburnea MCA 4105]
MVKETRLYEILEVSVTCSDAEIKKAYRRLSLIHHPDRQSSQSGSSTPVDHSKFQEIQNAYEILSDPEQRENYDRFGSDGPGRGGGGFGMEDDFMDSFFGASFGGPGFGGPGGMPGRSKRGRKVPTEPSVVELKVTLEEIYKGAEKKIEIQRSRKCTSCEGTGARAKAKPRPCIKCKGQGVIMQMMQMGPFVTRQQAECPACQGEGHVFRSQDSCKKCSGVKSTTEKKRVEITVERGSREGERIILREQGDEEPNSSAPGDLYVHLTIAPHPTFTISPTNQSDLQTTISITLSESLLGFNRLFLVHLDGRGLRVSQPAPGKKGWRVLKTGDLVVVKGEGLWRKGVSGDLICKIEVEMPNKEWAEGLGVDALVQLEKLLPPKRADIEHSGEIDDVELNVHVPKSGGSGSRGTNGNVYESEDEDDYEEDGPSAPGCHQQ